MNIPINLKKKKKKAMNMNNYSVQHIVFSLKKIKKKFIL